MELSISRLIFDPAFILTGSVVELVPVRVKIASPVPKEPDPVSVPETGKEYSVFTFVWPAIVIVLFVVSWVREIAFPAIILMSH